MPRARHTSRPPLQLVPLGSANGFEPTAERPVRSRARELQQDAHLEPHHHPWAQVAYCASGLLRVNVANAGPGGAEISTIVPPSRAVWIPAEAEHAVTVLEKAELRTLYVHAPAAAPDQREQTRVLVVSPLLRELIAALEVNAGSPTNPRELALSQLILDELQHAHTQPLGVPLPRDKRLRALCEAIIRRPGERALLADWARDIGASERTVARLFRDQLGMSYPQWRQQVVLAHALPLLARGLPVSQVAAASGYGSDSAFTAMFKAAMGHPPSHFQA